MSKATDKFRPTFSRQEMKNYYISLGAQAGALQAKAVIDDLRVSEISPELEMIRMNMSKIEELLRKQEVLNVD